MMFWIISGVLAAVVAGLLVLALLRGQRHTGPSEVFDVEVYKDQLREVDRDLERGIVSPEDAERIRTEVSRRLLAADAKAQGQAGEGGLPKAMQAGALVLVVGVVFAGTGALYLSLGATEGLGRAVYGDLSLANRIAAADQAYRTRPSQAEAEASIPATPNPEGSEEYAALVVRLREAVKERPDDIQGHALLVRSEAALGNFAAAYKAQARFVELRGEEATATDYTDQADMMVLAAGGYVSPEAELVLRQALALNPRDGVALYYTGLMMSQNGRPDRAFGIWDPLLRASRPQAPWVAPIRAQIEEMAWRAGVQYELPPLPDAPALPGPDADALAAAEDMTAEERQEMIRGMVEGLAERLATDGGTADEWARLIGALGVLGETERAAAIWSEAQTTFAEEAEGLALINAAAARAGLTE